MTLHLNTPSTLNYSELIAKLPNISDKVYQQNTEAFIKLLDKHNINVKDTASNGWTYLHYAAFNNNPNAIKALLKAGANIEAENNEKQTPLYLAGIMDNINSAKVLLEHGAKKNTKDSNGNNLLYIIELHNIPEMKELFKLEQSKQDIDIYKNEVLEDMLLNNKKRHIRNIIYNESKQK